jgi:hypothetical protein
MVLETYVSSMYSKTLRDKYPGLQYVQVVAEAVSLIKGFMRHLLDLDRTWTNEQWRDWIVIKIEDKVDGGVKVTFGKEADMEAWKAQMLPDTNDW